MRFITTTTLTAFLAGLASAHTANCWGKALNPPRTTLLTTITDFDTILSHPDNKFYPPTRLAEAHRCAEQYCRHGVSVRYCNEGDDVRYMPLQAIRDAVQVLADECVAEYKEETVAGGVLDHEDLWNVVVQQDDACEDRE
ncbi:uncharacterized protein BDV14DRAFT_204613 [Aspergillus stella-maris]|uniref:uncharacterized protein n=1 Tax=Aspergillus stella-maris TaxID=1810926 RepID=UPI003CCDD9D7